MQKLCRALIFLVGFSIPFNNVAFSFAGRNWSLGLILSAIYFLSMVSELPRIPIIAKTYGRYIFNVLWFAILLTCANFINMNYYGTPVLPATVFLCSFLLYVILLHARFDVNAVNYCLHGLAAGGILMAVFFVLGIGVEVEEDSRIMMFGENANALGIYMCLSSTIVFHDWILKDTLHLKWSRFLLLMGYLPMTILLFSTGSRVAFIAFVLSLCLCILFLFENVKKEFATLLFSVVICVVLYFIFVRSDFVLLERLIATAEEGNLSGREQILKDLWPYVTKHLFWGVGQTGYVDIARDAIGRVSSDGGALYGYSPHNVLVELILYTGIWGLLLFVWFWYQVFRRSWFAFRVNSNILPVLMLIPVVGCILSGQILTAKWAYIIYAYIIVSGSNALGRQKC